MTFLISHTEPSALNRTLGMPTTSILRSMSLPSCSASVLQVRGRGVEGAVGAEGTGFNSGSTRAMLLVHVHLVHVYLVHVTREMTCQHDMHNTPSADDSLSGESNVLSLPVHK